MCGIVGIVKFDFRETPEETRLKRMRDVLRHRGPDGEGLWFEGPVGLGHRRLSIVDVAGGHQPMANEDGGVWITYNGEIYNHAALRPGLEAKGHRYQTRGDTETILHLYEEEGDACVERLQGMFALALWDRKRERLLLARDRLGIKPLYYALGDRELLFASEIKAILAVISGRPALSPSAIPEFLATRFLAGDETFFQGIRKLPPGHVFTWSRAAGPRRHRYWCLPTDTDASSAGLRKRAADLRDRLEATVRSHLRCATRPLPVRRARLDRTGSPYGADGERSNPDIRGRLRRPREQRATVCQDGGAGGRSSAPRGGAFRGRVLPGAATTHLARGRADRLPVQHRAQCGFTARLLPRQGGTTGTA